MPAVYEPAHGGCGAGRPRGHRPIPAAITAEW